MIKHLFENLLFVLDLGSISYKEKKKLRDKITDNGGVISYIFTKASDFVIVPIDKGNSNKVDTYKSRKAQALKIPVLSADFLDACLKSGCIVDVDFYRVVGLTRSDQFKGGKIEVEGWNTMPKSQSNLRKQKTIHFKPVKQYVTGSDDCPSFSKRFHVGKFIFLEGCNAGVVFIHVLELHIAAYDGSSVDAAMHSGGFHFRIFEQSCVLPQDGESFKCIRSHEYFFESCEDALIKMQSMVEDKKSKHKMFVTNRMNHLKMGSHKLRHMLEEMGVSSGVLPAPVARLVGGITTLAFGELSQSLSVAVSTITPDQITKAVVLLMEMKQLLKNGKPTVKLSQEFNSAISLKNDWGTVSDMKALSRRQDFVQLLKDIMLVQEVAPDIDVIIKSKFDPQRLLALYRMLKCAITVLCAEEEDHEMILKLLCVPGSNSLPPGMEVRNVYSVHRDIEDEQFAYSLSPTKLLFHASDPQNLVGILSRGLLLPLVVASEHGTERTDIGMLGNAIYFADDIRKAIQYSKPNHVSGSRYVLINEVALGRFYDYTKFTPSLTHPPKGFDSVRGVASEEASDFDFNEYAIFNVEQQRIRYLVEFTLKEDVFIHFDDIPPIPIVDVKIGDENTDDMDLENEKVTLDDIKKLKNLSDQVKPGLLVKQEGKDQQIPLEEVHIRAKMMDMVAEVVVMQTYSNKSRSALEAKYVFPLDEAVAVCGFEAFINGKHVVGKVKEKEIAHKQYKAAIDAGHGAYLMDQEKPDVFTVSVGNLPPRAKVLIKITYVTELPVIPADDGSSDSIRFFIPGSVAAAAKKEVLLSGPVTQTKLDRITASSTKLKDSSMVISVEMPFAIRTIDSPTHKIYVKKTTTKACVRLPRKETIGDVGFELLVSLAEIHVPRMWAEQHPEDQESQACMLAFYPEFDAEPVLDYKAIILLDMSFSMKESTSENLEQDVKKLALMVLEHLPLDCFVNIVRFGSGYQELFVVEQHLGNNKVAAEAEEFIQSCSASSGSSEAWRPLTSLDILRKSLDSQSVTNVFMLSDGHLSEEHRLLQLARSLGESGKKNVTRIFTFSVGNSSNQYLLRSIAYMSGATHEHFSADSKSKWETKVENQLKKAGQPMLKDIRVEWKSYDDDMSVDDEEVGLPVQAPEKIKCLFNACRLVVYGFVSHCTQAELFATICGKEISIVVSTSQLSITKGKTLHRLAARAMIKDYEEGLPDLDPLLRDQLKTARKPHIIALSCHHDVVSPYTSFVAVEKRKKGEDMSSGDGPSVKELVNSAFLDPIPEVQWDQEALWEEMSELERIKKGIEKAKASYHRSVVECNRYIEEAESLAATLSDVDQKEAQLKLLALKIELQMDVEYPGEWYLLGSQEDVMVVVLANVDEEFTKVCCKRHAAERDNFAERFSSLVDQYISVCDPSEFQRKMALYARESSKNLLKKSEHKTAILFGQRLHQHMFCESSIDSALGRYLLKVMKGQQALEEFPLFLLEKDPQEWHPAVVAPITTRKFSEKLYAEKVRHSEAGNDDPRFETILKWWMKIPNEQHRFLSKKVRKMTPMHSPLAMPTSTAMRSASQFKERLFATCNKDIPKDTAATVERASSEDGDVAKAIAPLQRKKRKQMMTMGIEVQYDSAPTEQGGLFGSLGAVMSSLGKVPANIQSHSSNVSPRSENKKLRTFCSAAPFEPTSRTGAHYHPPPSGFGFGTPSMSAPNAEVPPPSGFSFGTPSRSAPNAEVPPPSGFGFGTPSMSAPNAIAPPPPSGFVFETSSMMSVPIAEAPPPPSGFVYETSSMMSVPIAEAPPPPSRFGFGTPSMSAPNAEVPPPSGFGFGTSSMSAQNAKAPPPSSGFGFGTPSMSAQNAKAPPPPSGLGFGNPSMSALIAEAPPPPSGLGFETPSMSALNAEASPPLFQFYSAGFRIPSILASNAKAPPLSSEFSSRPSSISVLSAEHPFSAEHPSSAVPGIGSGPPSGSTSSHPCVGELYSVPMMQRRIARTAEDSSFLAVGGGLGLQKLKRAEMPGRKRRGRHPLKAWSLHDNAETHESATECLRSYKPCVLSTARSPQYFPTSPGPAIPLERKTSLKGWLNSARTASATTSARDRPCSDDKDHVPMRARRCVYSRLKRSDLSAPPCNTESRSSSSESDAYSNGSDASTGGSDDFDSLASGFDFIFSLFGNKFSDMLNQLCQECVSDLKLKIWLFPTLYETMKGYDVITQAVSCFEEIVKSSGALSLGQQGYEAACMMIGVALMVAFCRERGSPPKVYVDWLNKMDAQYPMLYSRLAFGSSWSDAATNIVNRVVALFKEKSLSVEGLKTEIRRYCKCLLETNRQ